MSRTLETVFVTSLAFGLMASLACSTERRSTNPTIITGPSASTGTSSSRSGEGTTSSSAGMPADRDFAGHTRTVPRDTELVVRLSDRLSSGTNKSGDMFTATLDSDLYVANELVAPRGSIVRGRLTEVEEAGRVEGNARMTLTLTDIESNRRNYDIRTNAITVKAEDSVKDDAVKIGGGAGVGAIIGAIAGGGKGAAVGAAVGAAAGTGVVLATRGKRVEFDPEQKFAFYLQDPIRMQVLR